MDKKKISREDLIKFLKETENMFDVLHKRTNKALREYNEEDIIEIERNSKLQKLYPNLLDPLFSRKILLRKEFNDLQFERMDSDVKAQAEKLCNAEFELSVHQIFVRNFLSFLTPYNSLLLYHGLGTGKTCSAITVCEEMRDYMNQMGIKKKIIIVASPNVQQNFKTQLFDERKLKQQDGIWNIKACTGNKLLKEINPMNMKGLSKDKIVLQIKKIIRQSYVFMGYIEFSNYITNIKNKYTIEGDKEEEDVEAKIKAIQREFSNRLIVIDEVHNLRISGDSPNKKIGQNLLDMVKYSDTLKLLLLSATPMFNSHKEIVWLLNLMNLNDGRPTVELREIFDSNGNLLIKEGKEVGKDLLIKMMNGYVSYVRGENPYTFPYRIFPKEYDEANSIKNEGFIYPRKQLNGNAIIQGIEHIDLFMNDIGSYQQKGYEYAIKDIKRDIPDVESMESGMGWQKVEVPLQSLNFVYPNVNLDKYIDGEDVEMNVRDFIGKNGLHSVMLYNESKKNEFQYSERTLEKYGKIFSPEEIGKYSKKLEAFIQNVKKSKGIVLVYSQYIDGGCVPIALALEQIGITRYGGKNLFKETPVPGIDAITMKEKETGKPFKQAKYVMITGDVNLSSNNAKEVKAATNETNINGEDVKVVIISKAGTEGIDFNSIRQVHIMEPWYNMSRIEQTIGRAVRFRSHCKLPFEERNTEIYLYGTNPYKEDDSVEPIDLYIYRNAELKAMQVGVISRIMKEHAIDCYLTRALNELDEKSIDTTVKLRLSNGKTIDYRIGDKPYTQICDYMESCSYKCKPELEDKVREDDIIMDTYDENFIQLNIDKVMTKIKELFNSNHVMKKKDIIQHITQVVKYPLIQINSALDYLVNDKNEFIVDMFGNTGNLVNIGEYYMFQPIEITHTKLSRLDRTKPIDYKPEHITIEVKDDIKEFLVEGIDKKVVEFSKKYESLIEQLERNYKNAITPNIVKRGEKNWYIHCNVTIQRLSKVFNKELLEDFVIHHFVDTLVARDKKIIINTLLKKESLTELERKIKEYINNTILIQTMDKKGYFLFENKKLAIYIVEDKSLKIAEPLDIKDFSKVLKKKLVNKTNYNFIIGFMMQIRTTDTIVFKTKEVDAKRNAGARCDQAGKKSIIPILNKIGGEMTYTVENTKPLKTIQMCSEQEFLLRYYQHINKDEKQWFLNYELASLNEIEKLSR